ncbi:MAG: YaiI/YqxD family protein [Candidatus Izimaplasma sp.]|nr:YaiI/YqxD family protein [Candidatus Izimaplasma bacterium]
MRILVDADACPVKETIIKLAKKDQIDVLMFFDTAHVYDNDYAQVFMISKGPDTVDFALLNKVQSGDIVVTGDYGLASLALTKQAYVIHPSGMIYTEDNILNLLNRRSSHKKLRQHVRIKGPKKRTKIDDQTFQKNLKKVISKHK